MIRLEALAGAAVPILAAIAGVALAATTAEIAPVEGPPVHQLMLGGGASFVRTPERAACVASARLTIEASTYLDPATGAEVPFARVRRSYGASGQIVAGTPDAAPFLRLQLKYPVDPAAPAALTAGDRVIDLAPFLEPSGDSFALAEPALLAHARAALAGAEGLTVSAASLDTGRRIVDRLPPFDGTAFEACRAAWPAVAATGEPSGAITLSADVAPTPETRVAPPETAICGAPDPALAIHRGRLRRVTGFVSPTEDVYAGYDADGRLAYLSIPGVFEARPDADGGFDARVSRAADANDAIGPNRVKGCLGAAAIRLCETDPGATPGAAIALGPCLGDLMPEAAFALGAFDELPDPVAAARDGGVSRPAGGKAAGRGSGGFAGFGGGGSSDGGWSGPGEDPVDPPDAVVPAPPALVLGLTAAALLALLGLRLGRRGAPRTG